MSALDAVSAVTARLAAIASAGPHVYNMLRQSTTDAEFRQIFIDSTTTPGKSIVRAWRVTRTATKGRDEVMAAMSRMHTVEISGFMSFQDGVSEPVFQQAVEDICAAFDPVNAATRRFVSDQYPDGQFDWSGPMDVISVRLGMLGSVLVHAALLHFPVREFPV